MAWPIIEATKVHLDSAADDPSQARAEIAALIDSFNNFIGILAYVPGARQIPVTSSNGDIVLSSTKRFASTGQTVIAADGSNYLRVSATDSGGQVVIESSEPPAYSPDNLVTKYPLWHSGNDGTGSGMDADKLDGKQWVNMLDSSASFTPGQGRIYPLRDYALRSHYRITAYSSDLGCVQFKDGDRVSAYVETGIITTDWFYVTNSSSGTRTIHFKVDVWE